MRAVVYDGTGGRDVVAVRDVPEPELGDGEALVDVAFAGLNRADVLQRLGRYPVPVTVPGLEFAGIVRAVGGRVRNVAPGDRVCGLVASGAHAERVAGDAAALAKIPDGVTLREAAAIPEAFITAHDALFTRGGFALGQTVLVHAVGSSVGLAAVALAKRAGGIAIGTSRTAAKLDMAREHGLDFAFVLDDGWLGRALAATGGRGVDVVLDFVGAPLLDRNAKALRTGGRIVQIGTLGGANATIDLTTLMVKRATLHGTMLRTREPHEKVALAQHLERNLLPSFANASLRPTIDTVYPLDAIRDAHERMEDDANFGKILLSIAGE